MNFYIKALSIPILIPAVTTVAHAASFLIDFGAGSHQTAEQARTWNNVIIGSDTVKTPQPLRTTRGVPTTVTLVYHDCHNSAGIEGANPDGTTAPAGAASAYPPSATRDSLFGNTAPFSGDTVPTIRIVFSGLKTTEEYSFTYFASRMSVSDVRTTRYTLSNGSATVVSVLNAANNTSNTVTSPFLAPAPDGTLTLTLTKDTTNTNQFGFYYLGALEITTASSDQSSTVGAP